MIGFEMNLYGKCLVEVHIHYSSAQKRAEDFFFFQKRERKKTIFLRIENSFYFYSLSELRLNIVGIKSNNPIIVHTIDNDRQNDKILLFNKNVIRKKTKQQF